MRMEMCVYYNDIKKFKIEIAEEDVTVDIMFPPLIICKEVERMQKHKIQWTRKKSKNREIHMVQEDNREDYHLRGKQS